MGKLHNDDSATVNGKLITRKFLMIFFSRNKTR